MGIDKAPGILTYFGGGLIIAGILMVTYGGSKLKPTNKEAK